jgi:hypothetical protein
VLFAGGFSLGNHLNLGFNRDAALLFTRIQDEQNLNVRWTYGLAVPRNRARVVSEVVPGRHTVTAVRGPELIGIPINESRVDWDSCGQSQEQNFIWFEATCPAFTRSGLQAHNFDPLDGWRYPALHCKHLLSPSAQYLGRQEVERAGFRPEFPDFSASFAEAAHQRFPFFLRTRIYPVQL